MGLRVPTHQQIATRAYYIGQERRLRGCRQDSIADWVDAEEQLLDELNP